MQSSRLKPIIKPYPLLENEMDTVDVYVKWKGKVPVTVTLDNWDIAWDFIVRLMKDPKVTEVSLPPFSQ